MSNIILCFIILIIIVVGIKNKVNCFDSFLVGVKDGIKTSVNMFSNLLVFMIAIGLLQASGLLLFITELFDFEYSLLFIQSFVRPLSSSASLSIMIEIYNQYGVDATISIFSSMIHYVSDATLYLVPFYCGVYNIKNYNKIIIYGLIINIFSFLIAIIVTFLFLNIP